MFWWDLLKPSAERTWFWATAEWREMAVSNEKVAAMEPQIWHCALSVFGFKNQSYHKLQANPQYISQLSSFSVSISRFMDWLGFRVLPNFPWQSSSFLPRFRPKRKTKGKPPATPGAAGCSSSCTSVFLLVKPAPNHRHKLGERWGPVGENARWYLDLC